MVSMKTPFGKLDGASQRIAETADKAAVIVRDSLGILIGVAVVSVAALVVATIAIIMVRNGK